MKFNDNYQELKQFAEMAAKSSIIPKQYQGNPYDILLITMMGNDIGLTPMQSLQSIAVLNGRPSLYGDAAIALVRRHSEFENIREYIQDEVAYCEIKRKNKDWYIGSFSKQQAIQAGLWNRQGPWKTYPERMLKMRARGFALRDVFADALNGLITTEEANDYPVDNTQAENNNTHTESVNKTNSKTEQLDNILGEENHEQTQENLQQDHVSSDENQDSDHIYLVSQVRQFCEDHCVPLEIINQLLNRANCNDFSDMPYEKLQKSYEFLKNKYKVEE